MTISKFSRIVCYEKKENLTSVMLKERFKNRLKISNLIRICMEKHLTVTGWEEPFFPYKSFLFSVQSNQPGIWGKIDLVTFVVYSKSTTYSGSTISLSNTYHAHCCVLHSQFVSLTDLFKPDPGFVGQFSCTLLR